MTACATAIAYPRGGHNAGARSSRPDSLRNTACGAIALLALACGCPAAFAQTTTLNASNTATPWDNTAPLATGSGLTLNLGLGVEFLLVGGGGSGGGGHAGGGGGGVPANATAVTAGTYAIGIGTGGGSAASGSPSRTGGAGGSGIVIFRYQSGTRLASGGTGTTTGDLQVETVTSSRNVTVTYTAANLLANQSGVTSGSGALTYNNAGTLALTAANTFSGTTRVQAGTLNLANVLALQNSTLDLATADTGTLAVTALGAPGASAGVIFGTGVGTNPASGTARDTNWSLVAVPSSWTPPAAVPYPAYVVQTVPSTYVGGATGGVQNGYTADGTTSYWIAPQSTVNALVGTNYNWIVSQQFNVVRDGVYSFSCGGAGDDQISFFINGTVNTSNPVLPTITGGTQIGSTYASFSTIGTLTGAANLLAGTHTAYMVLNDFGGGTGAIITPGTFTPPEGTIVNAGGTLTKSGTGNLILSAANTYDGATTVAAGRLSVNDSLASSAVTVSGGTLGGSGSLAGTVAVQSGGTLAPGNSIESLAAGATTFAGGATFAYEVDSSAALGLAADLLVVTGDLSLSTDVNNRSPLAFVDIAGTAAPFGEDTTVFAMINYTGTWNGGLFSYNGQTLADGSRFSVGSQQWEVDYNYAYDTGNPTTTRPLNFQGDYAPASGSQTFVAVTAVPEPATLALLAAAGLAALTTRRK